MCRVESVETQSPDSNRHRPASVGSFVPPVFGALNSAPAASIERIRSFVRNEQERARFQAFHEEILREGLLLQDIVTRHWLFDGILEYRFEQVGFTGSPDDLMGGRVVLLRIDGLLFAVRLIAHDAEDGVEPVLQVPSKVDDQLIQVITCEDFLALWSRGTGLPAEQYDVTSTIQPYVWGLVSRQPLQMHGRRLVFESVLGQGLEGTVFLVRDLQSRDHFALKTTYKDLELFFEYWQDGFQRIRESAPELLPHLCEFVSHEMRTSYGSTLLMQYHPLISLSDALQVLSPQDRLEVGLRVLADNVRVIRRLHDLGWYHGDVGVSNTFLYRSAEGGMRTMLLDPFPDAHRDTEAHYRKDRFGIAHMLYWLASGTQWPEGTYSYLLDVMSGDFDPAKGRQIFSASTLVCDTSDYRKLHAAAANALGGTMDAYEELMDFIEAAAEPSREAAKVTFLRTTPEVNVSAIDVQQSIDRALKPIGSGVFLPFFSLPSHFGPSQSGCREYGMGDTGPVAYEFVRRLKASGQKYWVVLPIGPTDDRNCPYRTDSSFAISLNTISPQRLMDDGWICEDDVDRVSPQIHNAGRVAVGNSQVFSYKRKLLSLAYDHFLLEAQWKDEFARFVREEAYWLDDYAIYKTIERQHPGRWTHWPVSLREGDPATVRDFARMHADHVTRERFYQFLAQHYFIQLRDFAAEQGVRLIGDLPAYSMHGSADVWANRHAFVLTDDGQRSVVAGAPPDMFDPQGQGWNHPMYRWNDYASIAFLKKKYIRMRRLLADGFLREDHIIGKITPWGYIFGDAPAEGWRVQGRYLGNAFFDALIEEIPDLPHFLIGEDLGTVTEETKQLMQQYGFMGMKVAQFIPFNEGPQAIATDMYTPGNYTERNLLLLGTHDTPLIRRWWRDQLNDEGRYHFARYMRAALNSDEQITEANVAAVFTRFAMQQNPNMVIHMMQDLLVNENGSVGCLDGRVNDPRLGGDTDRWQENWSWRMPPEAFSERTMSDLLAITESSDRTPVKAIKRLPRYLTIDEEVILGTAWLRKQGQDGQGAVRHLKILSRAGRILRVRLSDGVSAALYEHEDGETYLLISDAPGTDDSVALPQRTLSVLRAFEAWHADHVGACQLSLSQVDDERLLAELAEEAEQLDDGLCHAVAVSSDTTRSEWIERIGTLLNPGDDLSSEPTARLNELEISPPEHASLSRRFVPTWTRLWQLYETRGMDRKNIISGILGGTLHGSLASLRGLRWVLAEAYRSEIQMAISTRDGQITLIDQWASELGAGALETVLFGYRTAAFVHNLDGYGRADGISGLLGLLQKARRKGQLPADGIAVAECADYTGWLIDNAGGNEVDRRAVRALVNECASDGNNHRLEGLLGLIEKRLMIRLASVAGALGEPPDPGYPGRFDMQLHSYHSDCGGQSVARIIYESYRRGLKTIALTDHQTFDGVPEALDLGELFGLRVIPAVELYTGIRKEDGMVHQRRDVLVYFPDTTRFRRWHSAGWDEETWQLFNDGWNRRLDGSQWGDVPIRRVTEWARARGGVPVLAHPGLLSAERFHQEDWAYAAFERLFQESGLAGIEISHSKLPFDENTRRYGPLVRQYNRRHPQNPIVFTMGTDSHAPDGIGRANLTEQAVRFVAEELADGQPDSLHTAILRSVEEAAKRIEGQAILYARRAEVLDGSYPVHAPLDRPLSVTRIDSAAAKETICAGIKKIDDRPVIIAINLGRMEHHEGKDWGAINVPDSLLSETDSTQMLRLREAITGEEFIRSPGDLARNGLRVGLPPMGTQFLVVESP